MATKLKTANWLKGKRVAVAGRLASMTRAEVAHLITTHGGIFSRSVTRSSTILIVGRGGWPLGKDGRPTRKLRQALWFAEQGHEIQILPEEELLARLHCPQGRLQRHSTLRELAEMLGMSAERLNRWLRAGLISPVTSVDGIRYFDFGQVAGAKSLCDLIRSGVTTARLRQSLHQLRNWVGAIEHPLAQLTTLEHSRQLVVRLENGQLAEPSGQLLLDFAPEVPVFPELLPWAGEATSAEQWFSLACAAEERGDLAESARCYRECLLKGGPTIEACFNLANVLYSMGQHARSEERYRQTLELDPHSWEAWNNLGTLLSHQEQLEEALAAYEQALRLHPHYADSHYNIADTLEEMGRMDEAREHWEAYLELEPQGAWALHARERLKKPLPR